MKQSHQLVILVQLSWLVLLSHCTSHPTLGRNRTDNIQCVHSEREALLQFKDGITDDSPSPFTVWGDSTGRCQWNGTTYYNCGMLTSWRRNTDCCKWRGVVCSKLTGHVVSLNVAGYDLMTCLTGTVSPSLGDLKHLKYLNLSRNWFYGEIPPQLGNLSRLTILDLGNCFQDPNGPSLSWISRLSLLRYLDLSDVNLVQVTNWMTNVNNLRSLSVLRMDGCLLPSKIPSSLSYINSSTTLHTISLSSNNFNDSSIFQWLFNLPKITTQLVYLDLSGNEFPFPVPNELANFHNLSYLALDGNGYRGSSLEIISKLCNLKKLYLGMNNFTDELSNVIQSLVNCNNEALETLDLSSNGFWGTIPNSISLLSSLRILYLDGNQLEGKINQAIGQLIRLETLDVSFNNFEDNITHTLFSKLVNLSQLSMSGNPRLVINISEDWIPPFHLDSIGLRSCQLGPRFPKWLQLQTNILYLDVSNNNISDNIPVSFWKSLSSNLMYLNMSYNQLYGTLPNRPDTLGSAMATIDLSSNLFEGVVPSWLANTFCLYLNDNRFDDCSILCPKTSYLEGLDLSNNLFSGEIPDCWMNFSQITSLHLENNNFSGQIRNIMPSLQHLHLYNNSFSGPFPTAFKNCTSLTILNIGDNLFTGTIPPWIGDVRLPLIVLMLRKNHFFGEIPVNLCNIVTLQILDLAINHFSGVIPNCIGNFSWMTGVEGYAQFDASVYLPYGYTGLREFESGIVSWKREEQIFKRAFMWVKLIDLSSNELSGEIPSEISILNGLQSLDLSRNKLIGKIPSEIGNLTALEFLDLSNNHLTGKIPISLAKVTTVGTLDVSNNNLSGEIPLSTQLQGFNASSYAGNPGLCGTPLPSCSKDRVSSNDPKGDDDTEDKKDDFSFFLGLYISVALGFITGFWVVFGTLLIKTSWRHAYFRFLDDIKDRVF